LTATVEPNSNIVQKFESLVTFRHHDVGIKYIMSDANTRALIKGNQGGGTAWSTYDAALRIFGMHPNKTRNTLNKPVRFISKCLPKGPGDEENQQYVEFKRFVPSEFIKKDVTARSASMTIKSAYGGQDLKVEFMAKTQDIDAYMSVQRSAYYQDEEIDRTKWDENRIRLIKEGGDSTICLTPVRGMDWTYDDIWKKASKIFRSKTICDRYGYPEIEESSSGRDIEIFCWATDDNPVMDPKSIDRIFEGIDDPDELAMRRYGVFRQVSGRIYKSFDKKVHEIPFDKVFDPSIFRNYWHFRMIDYHPAKPWYCSWVAVSPKNEWFIWNELLGRHDVMTNLDLRDQIKEASLIPEDHEFNRATLVDPLAKQKQGNTGFSTFEDITLGEYGLRRCTSADTKNKNGRMQIKQRLKNSLECGVPGNNLNRGEPDVRFGIYKPTIWFLSNCTGHINHFNSWRYVDWKQEAVKAVKDVKRESEKYSDYCRNIEFLAALNPVWYEMTSGEYQKSTLFQGRL
jgi:hypothetical protein